MKVRFSFYITPTGVQFCLCYMSIVSNNFSWKFVCVLFMEFSYILVSKILALIRI